MRYDVRTSSGDASYGLFDTQEAGESALRMVRRHDPNAQIISKPDWRDRALAAAEVVAPHMQAVGWSCPCCTAVDRALRGQQQ